MSDKTKAHVTGEIDEPTDHFIEPVEAVRSADEMVHRITVQRVRISGIMLMVLHPLGYLALSFGDAPRWLRISALIGIGGIGLGGALMVWLTRKSANFHVSQVAPVVGLLMVSISPTALYFGTSTMVMGLVLVMLFLWSMDAEPKHSAITVAVLGGMHFAVEVLFSLGVMNDPGLFRPPPSAPRPLLLITAPLGYVLVYVLGVVMQRRTKRTARDLENALQDNAMRMALLDEARQELQVAAGIGEPGPLTGQELGSFVLGPILGRGGMGEIYEASHAEDGRPAAIKVVGKGHLSTHELLERFKREAQLASRIVSPNVAKIYEISEHPQPYIAMERLYGEDLSKMLRSRGRLSITEARDMVRQIAAGLAAAREASVVHRDIKPSNLFRGDDGTWKLLDFGVARPSETDENLTGDRMVGTPAYMAPEQVLTDRVVDHRTDIHALAIVVFRALTGTPAFRGKDIARVVYSVVNTLPKAPSLAAGVPPAMDDVLRIALAKKAEDRFTRAEDFAHAFTQACAGRNPPSIHAWAERLNGRLRWGDSLHSGALSADELTPNVARTLRSVG